MISLQKIAILEAIPVRTFQNIWKFILAVLTVSFFLSFVFFLSVKIGGDIWHISEICYLLFCSIYSRLSCSLVIFCVRHYLFLALWFWTVLNGSSVFGILFILFLRSEVSSPSASFCPWDQSSWKAVGRLRTKHTSQLPPQVWWEGGMSDQRQPGHQAGGWPLPQDREIPRGSLRVSQSDCGATNPRFVRGEKLAKLQPAVTRHMTEMTTHTSALDWDDNPHVSSGLRWRNSSLNLFTGYHSHSNPFWVI